jgi:hypothetical protein
MRKREPAHFGTNLSARQANLPSGQNREVQDILTPDIPILALSAVHIRSEHYRTV